MEKKKYLTAYDYGTGAVWQYIFATNPEEITNKYSKLIVIENHPEWLKEHEKEHKLRVYDIEEKPDKILKGFI